MPSLRRSYIICTKYEIHSCYIYPLLLHCLPLLYANKSKNRQGLSICGSSPPRTAAAFASACTLGKYLYWLS